MRLRQTTLNAVWNRKPYEVPNKNMPRAMVLYRGIFRIGIVFTVFIITLRWFILYKAPSESRPWEQNSIDPNYVEIVQKFVSKVLQQECIPSSVRKNMSVLFSGKYKPYILPFLTKDTILNDTIFQYFPPFGFNNLQHKLEEILSLFPDLPKNKVTVEPCKRCVVVGSGGILRGLELGHLLDQFDVIIRLNNAPVKDFSKDVGTRTTIRMSYPEGSPKIWDDFDPDVLFVAVIYKRVDFNWLKAMVTKEQLSLFDWIFFWQEVAGSIPIKPSQFRILNPEIVIQTAMDLLQLPPPRWKLWGQDQNVPTVGVIASIMATYLCDEVSLAGFGYDLSQPEAPLHYYESTRMDAMKSQTMHNVDTERQFLASLVKAGVIKDLTGGIHCTFCKMKTL
ncbi:lactosylceramide alpha-2,3-sialyltransferase [Erpetoichthys calabaricus]|uniref:Lactosylceramide alpha-2,3-sialyltransferase n=1 Tax=Erpetoichthys calabaricus TaxID=27687 RepID=A0A8C4XEZ5_ERPCA|nr:lactosylceramide alpha-2,3-sialyltransferase [Erpetoichthys calabaricus]